VQGTVPHASPTSLNSHAVDSDSKAQEPGVAPSLAQLSLFPTWEIDNVAKQQTAQSLLDNIVRTDTSQDKLNRTEKRKRANKYPGVDPDYDKFLEQLKNFKNG